MNEKACIIGRRTLTEEYRIAQTDLSLCHYLHQKSHTEWPGIGLRSPRLEAGNQSPRKLHCHRVFYVLDSHENKRAGNAKLQSIGRNNAYVCPLPTA